MSRTYRAQAACPPGWEIRDGGLWTYDGLAIGVHCRQKRDDLPMADWPWVKWHTRDRKDDRKTYQRSYRARVRQAMAHQRWEGVPQWRRTSGWLTW